MEQGAQRASSRPLTGIWLAVSAAMLLSLKPVLIKLAYQYSVDSVTLMCLRMVFSLPFYLLLGIFFARTSNLDNWNPGMVLRVSVVGMLGFYLASFLDLEGLLRVNAQLERLILFAYPTLVVLLGALFFRQRITPTTLVALLVTYAGVAVIFLHDYHSYGDQVVEGSLLVAGSAICFALYILLSKSLMTLVGSQLYTCMAMTAASVAIVVHFLLSHNLSDLAVGTPVIMLGMALAIFCTVIPSFLINEAIVRLGSGPASIVGSVGPVFTSVFAVFLLGEIFTLYHGLGMLLVVVGVAVLGVRKKLPAPEAS